MKGIFLPFLGWVFLVPLAFIIPKKKKQVVFIGRDEGKFVDNVKYLYLYVNRQKPESVKCFFLTENKEVYQELKDKLSVVLYPQFKSILLLIRTSILIVDNLSWISGLKYHLLIKAKKVQLWHGAPLKKIGLDNKRLIDSMQPLLMKIYYFLKGRFPVYDLLLSPSPFFTKKSFLTALKSKKIVESGYPRNEPLIKEHDPLFLLGTDQKILMRIKDLKNEGFRIIPYLPTFRGDGKNALSKNIIDIPRLSKFGMENNIAFIFKFHSWELSSDLDIRPILGNRKSILLYDNSKDIYPLLPLTDLLITDYSSIYFDYLLLNKPMIFFPFDLAQYQQKDRDLYFDYESMTPGPKCFNQKELEEEILQRLKPGSDDYQARREELKKQTFITTDGQAAKRIWNSVKKNFSI